MIHLLRRHPWAMQAHLEWSLAMVFSVPAENATTLLSPGMQLDTYEGHAFVAAAFVRTRQQRPVWMPSFMADDFHLAGWRVFVRVQLPDGRMVRGLRILRSDTDSNRLARVGSWLTHYHFRPVRVQCRHENNVFEFKSCDIEGHVEADFSADLTPAAQPPAGSPFPDLRTARRFAGPMPYTFSYEEETDSLVIVEGSRQHWQPRAVTVHTRKLSFFERPPFSNGGLPPLANAFWVENVDYRWAAGQIIPAHLSPSV